MRPVNRPITTIVAALAVLATGCATFSDNDAVARVGDVELDAQALADLVGGPDDGEPVAVPAARARTEINEWIRGQVTNTDGAVDAYEDGVGASGSVCVDVMVVDSSETAQGVVSQLDEGADFEILFQEFNVDPSLPAPRFGCVTAQEIADNAGNPFADALLTLDAASNVSTVEVQTQPGSPPLLIISQWIPFDQLSAQDQSIVTGNLPVDTEGFDIYVDPRYGTFDPVAGVVPLG